MPEQHSYDTLSEATTDLQRRGYTEDFNIQTNCLLCVGRELEIHPEDFAVDEVYRFEGASDPGDNSVIYAISSKDGLKGMVVDAYGVYADSLSEAMIQKLKITY